MPQVRKKEGKKKKQSELIASRRVIILGERARLQL
jgi:hypothetical protein